MSTVILIFFNFPPLEGLEKIKSACVSSTKGIICYFRIICNPLSQSFSNFIKNYTYQGIPSLERAFSDVIFT